MKNNWAKTPTQHEGTVELEYLKLKTHRLWSAVEGTLRMIEARPELPQNKDKAVVEMVKRFAEAGYAYFEDCLALLDKAHEKIESDNTSNLWTVLDLKRGLNKGLLDSEGSGPLPQLENIVKTIDQLTLLPYLEGQNSGLEKH